MPVNTHTHTHTHTHTIAKRETESLQLSIQEKNGEIRQLQKQLSDLERDKHTELVKLRLEVSKHLRQFSISVYMYNTVIT